MVRQMYSRHRDRRQELSISAKHRARLSATSEPALLTCDHWTSRSNASVARVSVAPMKRGTTKSDNGPIHRRVVTEVIVAGLATAATSERVCAGVERIQRRPRGECATGDDGLSIARTEYAVSKSSDRRLLLTAQRARGGNAANHGQRESLVEVHDRRFSIGILWRQRWPMAEDNRSARA
jgi:hypothetical protein